MSRGPFSRGAVVWHPAPVKRSSGERPYLVLSDSSHPFHGSEYAVVGLTRTKRPPAVELDRGDWRVGSPGTDSFASPWYVFTIKHADIDRPKGGLTPDATDRVASAAGRMLGVP